jgi:hypothetical protein
MVKCLEALVTEENEEGLLIAADWEKAFDRVSWDYLHDATEALGFGPQMRGWFEMMYNAGAPPKRRVRANGEYSAPFEVLSGTPQGCPLSPLIFLLVAEGLTRVVMEDEELLGIRVAGREYKLSQFADDTQFLLRNYTQMPRMWQHIDEYEEATAMKANVKKFEGVRLGRLRGTTPPATETKVRFVAPGQYIKILGVPFYEQLDITLFWLKLYAKMKCKIAAWHDHHMLTARCSPTRWCTASSGTGLSAWRCQLASPLRWRAMYKLYFGIKK